MEIIAHMESGFATKFGIPRQSGLVEEVKGRIVFEKEYRDPLAVRGLDGFSHIWLLWQFSEHVQTAWSPTVKPPRLGGKKKVGVFATRSPFRPNPIGLSCVRLEKIELNAQRGPILYVAGADLMDSTPIYDIKPYLPYTDCHLEAIGGFAQEVLADNLQVICPPQLEEKIPAQDRQAVYGILEQDPRPHYQNDANRIYGIEYAGLDIRFCVKNRQLEIVEIVETTQKRAKYKVRYCEK